MTGGVPTPFETLLIEANTQIGMSADIRNRAVHSPRRSPNLADTFVDVASAHPEKPAMTFAASVWSYSSLLATALGIRDRLQQSPGFKPLSRVLVLLPNSADYVAAFYGTLLAGGVVVPLAPKTETRQLLAILGSTQARHVITQTRFAKTVEAPAFQKESLSESPVDSVDEASVPEELAAIFFTGGSTGQPKGVMLSHQNLLENARSIQKYLNIQPADQPLCVLPFYHAFGNSVLQSHLLAGAHLVVDGNVTFPETLVSAIDKHRATSLSGVPDLFRYLLERSSLGTTVLPSLTYMAVAGGSLPHDLALKVVNRISPAKLYVMYGQTEATARLAFVPPDRLADLGPGCIGQAVPGVELQIVDGSGGLVETGKQGEIRARGLNVMLGYWQDRAMTREAVRDGWLYTGDLGVQDPSGWIYHRGRKNALIKIAGYRIHPTDVEDYILRALPVQQAVVVPFEMGALGTRLALYVRLNPGTGALMPSAIVARCRADLPRHMVPDEVQIVEQFPLNDALKIDRPRLIEMAISASAQRRKIA